MPITYSCPHCGKQFSSVQPYVGKASPDSK
jgi:DNA-directed RNA polymerase subunit RPC12/RpoP